MAKKLTRSNKDKIIAGVSAGLGEYFQLDVV
ncbi:PspC domain-containing protein, partial [Pseudoxanthomonas sp. SGD-10]